MDLAKVLLDKFFGFIAAIIPGCFVVLVVVLHHRELWQQLWDTNYLGYQTKVAILVFAAFVAGITVTSFVGAVLGVVIFDIANRRNQKMMAQAAAFSAAAQQQPQLQQQQWAQAAQLGIAPDWRNANWRSLLTAYLGNAAPANLVTMQWFQGPLFNQQMAFNDQLWMDWWNRLHLLTLPKGDPKVAMALTLESSFGGAALVVLLSAPWTPILRQWWILLPCLFWILMTIAQTVWQYRQSNDPWQSYLKQMNYLQLRVGKGEKASDDGESQ